LNMLWMHFLWTSFSSMLMIHRFVILMMSQRSCIIISYILILFSLPWFDFSLTSSFVSSPHSLFILIWSTGWNFSCVFIWFIHLFSSKISIWIFPDSYIFIEFPFHFHPCFIHLFILVIIKII
jgi:hypothetical protein